MKSNDMTMTLINAHLTEAEYQTLAAECATQLDESTAREAKLTEDMAKLAAQNDAYTQALINAWDENQHFTALETAHKMMAKRMEIGPLALQQAQRRTAKLRSQRSIIAGYLNTLINTRVTRERLQADAEKRRADEEHDRQEQQARWWSGKTPAERELLARDNLAEQERKARQIVIVDNRATRQQEADQIKADAQAQVEEVLNGKAQTIQNKRKGD